MSYQDKHPTCPDCSRSFIFSAQEQGLCGELGYEEPKRCRTCRQSREDARHYQGSDRYRSHPRELLAATVPSARNDQRSLLSRITGVQPIAVTASRAYPLPLWLPYEPP